MRNLLLTLTIALLQVSAFAKTYAGPVKSSTYLLNRAQWNFCEIQILNKSEETLEMQLTLKRDEKPTTFVQILTLTKEGRYGLIPKLTKDYGWLTPEVKVNGKFNWYQTNHLVKFSEDEQILQYQQEFLESDHGFHSTASNLKCELREVAASEK